MPDLLSTIESHLNSPHLRDNLTPLFCEALLWGRPQASAFAREVSVRRQEKAQLTFAPVAQLSGLPVFRVDWPYDKLPNVTQRRAVHRALAPTYIEYLLAYVTADDRQATFVWARRRRSKIHVYPNDWEPLPIAPIPMEEQQEFVRLVDAILAEFEQYGYPLPPEAAARVSELEREIDERVGELYGV